MVRRTAGASRTRVGLAALLATLLASLSIVAAGGASPTAETAKKRRRSLSIVDTVRLTLVRRDGNVLYERGTATGTLPGTVSARFVTSLTKVTGRLTFYPYSGGSITMTAVGYPRSTRRITGLSGSMAVRGGSGRFRNALGSGSFTGTANRGTWSVTVNARANITY